MDFSLRPSSRLMRYSSVMDLLTGTAGFSGSAGTSGAGALPRLPRVAWMEAIKAGSSLGWTWFCVT